MKEDLKIKCFKCKSDKMVVGFPRVDLEGKPQLEIDCADCGWDLIGISVGWDTVQMFDMAEKVSNMEVE